MEMKDNIAIATLVVALVALVAVGVLGSEDSSGSDARNVEVSLAGHYYASDVKIAYEDPNSGYAWYSGPSYDRSTASFLFLEGDDREAGEQAIIKCLYNKDRSGFVSDPVDGQEYYVYYSDYSRGSSAPEYNGHELKLYSYNEDKKIYLSAGTHDIKQANSSNTLYLCPELDVYCEGKIELYSYSAKTVTLAVGGYYYVIAPWSTSGFTDAKTALNITNYSDNAAQKKSDVSGTVDLTSDNVWVTKEVKGRGQTDYTGQAVFFVKGSDKAKEFYDEYVSKNKYYSEWPSSTYLESGKTYVEYRLYEGIYTERQSEYTICNDNVCKMYIEYGNELKFVPKFTESDYSVYLAVDTSIYRLDSLTEYTYKPDKTGYVYLYLVSEKDDDCMGGTIGLDVSGAVAKDDNAVIPAVICLVLFALAIAVVVISIQKPKWAVCKTE